MRALLALLLWLAAASTPAATVREQGMSECRPGERVTWGDGRDRPAQAAELLFFIDVAGAPAWFSPLQQRQAVQRAAAAWSQCGVPAQVLAGRAPPGAIQLLWSDAASRGNFALANLTQRQLALSPAMFKLLRERNPKHPAEETLQMTISHEMGHFFGLMAHSRRCVDVMSYYDDGKGGRCVLRDERERNAVTEYRALLPTACDIERCRAANKTANQAPQRGGVN